jgi:K+:H+ antiporter
MNLDAVTTAVIGDIAVIVVVSSALGKVASRLGQPAVVGQILAGILLGPSVLGRLPGNPTAVLFPTEARPFLMVLSQVAIVLFMFAAGYAVDVRLLRSRGRHALLIAVAALVVPMATGASAAALLHNALERFDPAQAGGWPFLLFMAVATSITALPVLAAIVAERQLSGTQVGTIAITVAGLMDVGAWIALAVAFAGTGRSGGWPWPVGLLLVVGLAAAMILLVRPVLTWWMIQRSAVPRWVLVPLAVGLAFAGAWATAALGLHPVFGAFLAGVCTPRSDGAADVLRAMEHAASLLLPLFFAVSGLSFEIGAVDSRGLILLMLLLGIAVITKVGPAYAVGRLTGLAAHPSAQIAVLVNTRGLTEIVVLNLALSQGVIGRPLFTVFVLMALLTTAMTGPLLWLLDQRTPSYSVAPAALNSA